MVSYLYVQLGDDVFVKFAVARHAIQLFVKADLPQYFALVYYQKLAGFIRQNSYAAFIVFEIDQYMKLTLRVKT